MNAQTMNLLFSRPVYLRRPDSGDRLRYKVTEDAGNGREFVAAVYVEIAVHRPTSGWTAGLAEVLTEYPTPRQLRILEALGVGNPRSTVRTYDVRPWQWEAWRDRLAELGANVKGVR